MNTYILNEADEPVYCSDIIAWGKWLESSPKHCVASDIIGDSRVSTIFLGMDHSWTPGGPPILWETMIFGGKNNLYCERYSSLQEAKAGHIKAIERVKAEQE